MPLPPVWPSRYKTMSMIHYTLLPLPEKNALIREYRVRVAIVACFIFSLSGLIYIGALFPAYMKAYSEKNDAMSRATLAKNSGANNTTSITNVLSLDATLLASASKSTNIPHISSLVESITTLRSDIKITSMAFSENGSGDTSTSTYNVAIEGLAPTRDSLIAWKTRLEDLSGGQKVDLPIAQLAKDKNISFSITVNNLKL